MKKKHVVIWLIYLVIAVVGVFLFSKGWKLDMYYLAAYEKQERQTHKEEITTWINAPKIRIKVSVGSDGSQIDYELPETIAPTKIISPQKNYWPDRAEHIRDKVKVIWKYTPPFVRPTSKIGAYELSGLFLVILGLVMSVNFTDHIKKKTKILTAQVFTGIALLIIGLLVAFLGAYYDYNCTKGLTLMICFYVLGALLIFRGVPKN
jgi:hypothetical protein